MCSVGQNHIYIQRVYSISGREITKYTVIYGVYIRFYPTLFVSPGPCMLTKMFKILQWHEAIKRLHL